MSEEIKKVSDPFAQEVERLTKVVTKYEEKMIKAWTETKVYDATTSFEAGPSGAENIVGVGIGEQITGGKPTGKVCVKVYVAEKTPEDEVQSNFIAPEEIDGETVDVEAVGLIEAFPFTRRYRPVPGGVSTSLAPTTRIGCYAGTIGCFCSSIEPKEPILLLSNNHVFAYMNQAAIGSPIIQPGCLDGGVDPKDRIATLLDFVPIDFTGKPNLVDAALAKVTKSELIDPNRNILEKGKVRGAALPTLRAAVKKSGRTTQDTHGIISGIGATLWVGYGSMGSALFKDQVIITPGGFSAPGDSGSVILDGRNRVRALLFAGSSTHTIANSIKNVYTELSKPPRTIRGVKLLDC